MNNVTVLPVPDIIDSLYDGDTEDNIQTAHLGHLQIKMYHVKNLNSLVLNRVYLQSQSIWTCGQFTDGFTWFSGRLLVAANQESANSTQSSNHSSNEDESIFLEKTGQTPTIAEQNQIANEQPLIHTSTSQSTEDVSVEVSDMQMWILVYKRFWMKKTWHLILYMIIDRLIRS